MTPPFLLGRRAEQSALDALLADARSGHSGTLVLCGEAGMGKSSLLEFARARAAPDIRVVGCVGQESESLFAFAGLQQLCAPLLGAVDRIPETQRAALDVAFGIRAGSAPDRYLVGLATLSLLAEAAEGQPVLCIVDDAQWLDEATTHVLAFVARRIAHERVAMLFARREPAAAATDPLSGVGAELHLGALGDADARELLQRGIRAPLDDRVRERILAEARGNPLALLELPRHVRPAELAGGFSTPPASGIPHRIEDTFRQRSAGLSDDARFFLLLAAADATGDAALLWRAAENAGIERSVLAQVEQTELLEIDTRARFRHPLVRSAVYDAATQEERRRAHRALAEATDAHSDPDRRAWHRAMGVAGVDEDAAAALESSAERTRARGGVAAAAAFLARAVELTPDAATRARRALSAAHAKHDAGALATAQELLATAALGPLDELQRARLHLLRARTAFHLRPGSEAPGMLLTAARELAPLDPGLARETYLHALDATLVTDASRVGEVAEAARAAPAPPTAPTPPDLLLDALVTTFTRGYAAGAPAVRDAMAAFRERGFDGEALGEMGSRRWMWLATRTAAAFYDDDLGFVLAERNVNLARGAGALSTLPLSLVALSASLVLRGELSRAEEVAEEAASLAAVTGAAPLGYAQLFLAAWTGRTEDAERLIAGSTGEAETRSQRGTAHYAQAVLYNSTGAYAAAREAAIRANELGELVNTSLTLPELVEAAARSDEPTLARDAAEEITARAEAARTPWARGLAARSRALAAPGGGTEDDYREAIHHLGASNMRGHLARTHLVYGEWLRREGRRQDARDHLRAAHDALSKMGANGFAARAARELRATGATPVRPASATGHDLTAQEQAIARLVAAGATSREVGTQLFLSHRTIDAHLRNIYRKLGIGSRRQLRGIVES